MEGWTFEVGWESHVHKAMLPAFPVHVTKDNDETCMIDHV